MFTWKKSYKLVTSMSSISFVLLVNLFKILPEFRKYITQKFILNAFSFCQRILPNGFKSKNLMDVFITFKLIFSYKIFAFCIEIP